jgi:hypothetical protein
MFTEPLLHAGLADHGSLEALALELFGTAEAFSAAVNEKRRRNVIEPYAAFQPFNESARAIEPILAHLLGNISGGDLVLDTWCRTGWSGEWLSGMLPAQTVVSMWEGNSSVLGYRGFHHLLGSRRRAPNLDVIFANSERPLPFADQSFALLYAHDALHRQALYPFTSECLRVTRGNAALVFAHVHLSNSEPEPFFERGGRIVHGRDYRAWLDVITADTPRRGAICSEQTLFCAPPMADIRDETEMAHYNALVAILPREPRTVAIREPDGHWRYIVSPLFRFDLARGLAKISPNAFAGAVEELLLRHPMYRAHLPPQPVKLDAIGLLALILASAGLDRDSLMKVTPADAAQMDRAVDHLIAAEILRPAPVSEAGHRLQRFHSNQLAWDSGAIMPALLTKLRSSEAGIFSYPDGNIAVGREATEIALRVASSLTSAGLRPGDWIDVACAQQPLLWLAALAAAGCGINVNLDAASAPEGFGYKLRLYDREDSRIAHGPAVGCDLQALIALLENAAPANIAVFNGRGLLRFHNGGATHQVSVGDLASGCHALSQQVQHQMLLLDATDTLKSLVSALYALSREEKLH